MKILLISDLHLDDSAKNKYRWDIFGQVYDVLRDKRIDRVYILGDLTDNKDRHSSKLVNEVVYQLNNLNKHVQEISILIGNHDYIDQSLPFFAFTNMCMYNNPFTREINGIKEVFLPHVKDPSCYLKNINLQDYDVCFTHLDVRGSKLDNGMKSLQGLPVSFFKCKTFSGHIHNGQTVGKEKNFTYIGSPYSTIYEREDAVHRGIILEYRNNVIEWETLEFEFPRKISKTFKYSKDIEIINDNNFYKYNIDLDDKNLTDYSEFKSKVDDSDSNIILNPKINKSSNVINIVETTNYGNYFKSFCRENNLSDDLIKIAKEIIENNQ